jgi:GNAT superfamily N-acetyltransferase
MVESVKIVKASEEDLMEILRLQKIAFKSEAECYGNSKIAPMLETPESIREDYKSYLYLKAKIDGNIVGSIRGRQVDSYCWIGRLFVIPEYRKRGIAKKLIAEMEKQFPEADYYTLYTGFRSKRNIALYESLGYKLDGLSDKKDGDVDLVNLRKTNIK